MTGKGLNLFDECIARCVHPFPQQEECNSKQREFSLMLIIVFNFYMYRSSRSEVFLKKGVLRNFAKLTAVPGSLFK